MAIKVLLRLLLFSNVQVHFEFTQHGKVLILLPDIAQNQGIIVYFILVPPK